MEKQITHTLQPLFDAESRILILGTMPSPKSREIGFYYGHPQNRFWKVLPDLFSEKPFASIAEKEDFLYRHHIALWDVLQSCSIDGASDSSIKNPMPNDFTHLLQASKVGAIFTTGGKAAALYKKYCEEKTGISAIPLPSTSPANCRMTYPALLEAYAVILKHL